MVATGRVLFDGFTVIEIVVLSALALLSTAVSVIWCVPEERLLVVKLLPLPIVPSMLDVQVSDLPVSTRSSVSVADPVKVTELFKE